MAKTVININGLDVGKIKNTVLREFVKKLLLRRESGDAFHGDTYGEHEQHRDAYHRDYRGLPRS